MNEAGSFLFYLDLLRLVTAHSLRRNEDAQILYAREDAVKIGGVKDGFIVAGHTLTIAKGTVFYTGGEVYRMHDEGRNCIFYNIDCGCAYHKQNPNGTLACLRMEDEEVFYLWEKCINNLKRRS